MPGIAKAFRPGIIGAGQGATTVFENVDYWVAFGLRVNRLR